MIMRVDHDKTPAFRLADAEEEPGIGLLIDKCILGDGRANPVPHHL